MDIVERLRKATDTNTPVDCGTHWNLEEEAAEEIEKLREVLSVTREEIYRLREAIMVQLCETDDSEYMTGSQRDQFARDALTPNAKVKGGRDEQN